MWPLNDWRETQIISIYKKGSRLECSNYRGISVVGKVYARAINDRVKLMTVDNVMDEQGGFKAGRGCNDQFFQSGRLWRRPSISVHSICGSREGIR